MALAAVAVLWPASCAVPLGPGYEVQKQEVRVDFAPAGSPIVQVNAEYRLKNTGNQPLPSLELRLPGRRFHVSDLVVTWDGTAIAPIISPDNPRDSLLQFTNPWAMTTSHALRLAFTIDQPAGANGSTLAADAFFLPEGSWSPELVPSRGLFAFGGVPPNNWDLTVVVPQNFRVHSSGESKHVSRKQDRVAVRFEQTSKNLYPFVVAGRYADSALGHGERTIHLWTRSHPNTQILADASGELARELDVYDAVFGTRGKQPAPIWIVECPAASGCVTGREAPFLEFFGEQFGAANAEMISFNTAVVDMSGESSHIAAIVAPSLAASWLGYGRNPGFFEQKAPLSALPLFAAALAREAVSGPSARVDMIRRALAQVPEKPQTRTEDDPRVLRAKSFLFFYALRDRYGPDVFRNAVQHMLSARRGVGFDLDDFIAAFEQETHQNIAAMVRLWMKHPGVPQEFRDRYGETSAAAAPNPEEKQP